MSTLTASDYQVGDTVQVRAYGRWRNGRVTKIGRTRIYVRFIRNQQGDQDERPFIPMHVRRF